MDRRSWGYLLALASAAAGAVRYNLAVFAKEGYGFDYASFLAYALAVGVVCSAIHVGLRDGARGFLPLRGRWHHAWIYGVLMGWSTLTHFLALDYLNETVMVSLAQSRLLITISLAVWLLGERFTRQEILAAFVVCVGALAFRPWATGNWKGMAILFTGVVSGAFASIGAKVWVAGTPPRVLMLWRNLIALLIVGGYTALFRDLPTVTLVTALACVATGILGPYLHGLFFLQALERIEAAKASLMGRVAPVIVFLISWLALDKLPTRSEVASAVVLVIGTAWLTWARPRN